MKQVCLFLLLSHCLTGWAGYPLKADSLGRVFLNDGRHLISGPFHWDQGQWTRFGVGAVAVVALSAGDREISSWFSKHQTRFVDGMSKDLLAPFGDSRLYRNYSILALAGMWGASFPFEDVRLRRTCEAAGEAMIFAAAITGMVKAGVGRYRPWQTDGQDPFRFKGPNGGDFVSFPSGHTSFVFAMATVFSREYSETAWVPVLGYGTAVLVGLSRVYDQQHWASDVLAGAALGWALGRFVTGRTRERLSLVPATAGQYPAMGLVLRF